MPQLDGVQGGLGQAGVGVVGDLRGKDVPLHADDGVEQDRAFDTLVACIFGIERLGLGEKIGGLHISAHMNSARGRLRRSRIFPVPLGHHVHTLNRHANLQDHAEAGIPVWLHLEVLSLKISETSFPYLEWTTLSSFFRALTI